jgi:hypothetical protein
MADLENSGEGSPSAEERKRQSKLMARTKNVSKQAVVGDEDADEDEGGADDYDMPGQTKATPEENEPLRIFYESLYRQKPTSKMAEQYCLDHGLLPLERAQEVYDRI